MARRKAVKGATETVRSLDEVAQGRKAGASKGTFGGVSVSESAALKPTGGLAGGDGFLWSQAPQQAISDALLTPFSELWLWQALLFPGVQLRSPGSCPIRLEAGRREECLIRATSKLGGEGGLQMLVNTALLVRNAVILLLL